MPVFLNGTVTGVEVKTLGEVDTSLTEVLADVEGKNVTFACHAGFLLEALKAFNSEVVFEIAAPNSPVILRPLSDTTAFLHMIMPMTLEARL